MRKDATRLRFSNIYLPAAIALNYAIIATLWLIYSNRIVRLFVDDPTRTNSIQLFADLSFIFVTAALLLYLVRMSIQKYLKIQEKQRFMFEALNEGVILLDKNYSIVEANNAFVKLIDAFNKKELIGKNILEYVSVKYRTQVNDDLSSTADGQRHRAIECIIRKRDDSEFPAEINIAALRGPSGKTTGFVANISDISDSKRAILQIVNLSRFPQEDPNPVLRVDRNGIILFANKAADQLLQKWQSEMGKPIPNTEITLVTEASRSQSIQVSEFATAEKVYSLYYTPVKGADYVNIYGLDITQRKQSENIIQRLNNVLLTIRNINQLIVQIEDEKELFQKACEAIIYGRHYSVARVHLIQEGTFNLLQIASASIIDEPMNEMKITWDDSQYGQGVTGQAIKTRQPAIMHNVDTDSRAQPWRDMPEKFKVISLASLPLIIQGRVIGALTVSSEVAEAFNAEEIRLMIELAGDVSLGIQKIRQLNELKELENKYAELVEKNNDGILILQDGVIKFANSAITDITQLSKVELENRNFIDFVAPEYVGLVSDSYRQRIEGISLDKRYEVEIFNASGKRIPIEVNAAQIHYQGRPAVMGILRDISEHKKAEKQILLAARLLDEVNDSIILTSTIDGRILYVNGTTCSSLGYTGEELLNLNILQLVAPERLASMDSLLQNVLEKREFTFKDIRLRKDGTRFPVEIHSSIIEYQGQDAVLSVTRDITEREKAELALRENEGKYQEVVERANDGICIIHNLIVEYCNRSLAQMWGGSIDEVIGKPFMEFIHPDSRNLIIENYKQRMAGKSVPPMYPALLQNKNGSKVYTEINTGIISYKGKPADLIIVRDITDRVRAEGQIRLQAQLLDNSTDIIFAHDLEDEILYANPAAYNSLGYSKEEILQIKIIDLLGDISNKSLKENKQKIIDYGKNDFEGNLQRRDGSILTVEARLRLIDWENRKIVLSNNRDITKRKQAEELLRESEKRFRLLAENAQDVIFRYGLLPSPHFEYMSPAVKSMTGYDPANFYDNQDFILEIIHPEDRSKLKSLLEQNEVSNDPIILRWLHKDGRILWVEQRNTRITNDNGKPIAYEGIAREITERKIAEERITHLNSVLKALRNVNQLITREKDRAVLIQQSCDMMVEARGFVMAWILLVDAERKYIASAMAGGEELQSTLFLEFNKGRYPVCVDKILDRKDSIAYCDEITENSSGCMLGAFLRKGNGLISRLEYEDKTFGVIAMYVAPGITIDSEEKGLFEELAGDIAFALASIEKEQERNRLDNELRYSEEKHRMLFETMTEGVVYLDDNGKVISANSAAERFLGMTAAYLKSISLSELSWKLIWEDGTELTAENHPIKLAMQTGVPIKGIHIGIYKSPSEKPMWLHLNVVPQYRHGETRPYQIYITFDDVTEKKEADARTLEMETLKQLNKAKSELLANVSHELRTPLASIKGNIETLIQDDVRWSRKRQLDFLNSANLETDRLNFLISDLLDMSRLDSGKLVLDKQIYDFGSILDSAMVTLASLTKNHHLDIELSMDLPRVQVDKARVVQVLTNLVENSVKFSPEGSHILIQAVADDTNVIINVRDQGEGIPRDMIEKLFDRFFQVQRVVHGKTRGSGLGLSICKGIIEAHDGRIWVKSNVGSGTTLSFSLPAYKSDTTN